LHLLENFDGPLQINVGTGSDVTIRQLASMVAGAVGYEGGAIEWDTSKPDGTPQKLLDVTRIHQLGWKASIPLQDASATLWIGTGPTSTPSAPRTDQSLDAMENRRQRLRGDTLRR
jgi:nucleoside-diphosphate-sugar epimerase